jgi:hypothetical protein
MKRSEGGDTAKKLQALSNLTEISQHVETGSVTFSLQFDLPHFTTLCRFVRTTEPTMEALQSLLSSDRQVKSPP